MDIDEKDFYWELTSKYIDDSTIKERFILPKFVTGYLIEVVAISKYGLEIDSDNEKKFQSFLK